MRDRETNLTKIHTNLVIFTFKKKDTCTAYPIRFSHLHNLKNCIYYLEKFE